MRKTLQSNSNPKEFSMNVTASIFFFAAVVACVIEMMDTLEWIFVRIERVKSKLPYLSDGELSTWHREIAYEGKDPFLTLAACHRILRNLPKVYHTVNPAFRHLSLCSDYYGQVKFLVTGKQYRYEVGFLFLHFWYAARAVATALWYDKKFGSSDIEVLSAGLFMISMKVPGMRLLLGWLPLFFLKLSARRMNQGTPPMTAALTVSKCYALTRRKKYLDLVKMLGLSPRSDEKDLRRVAEHFGMTLEEFRSVLES